MFVGGTCSIEMKQDRKRWQFPQDPFVEYEKSDERWARPIGFGREVTEQVSVRFPNVVITGMEARSNEWRRTIEIQGELTMHNLLCSSLDKEI